MPRWFVVFTIRIYILLSTEYGVTWGLYSVQKASASEYPRVLYTSTPYGVLEESLTSHSRKCHTSRSLGAI